MVPLYIPTNLEFKDLYMIKRMFLAVGLSLPVGSLCAQSTMPASGGTARGANGSVSYTVGQVDYLFSSSISGNAVAGVQQPFDDNTAYHTNCDGVELTIFPNPTSADLYVSCDVLDASYPYMLTDMIGKILFEGELQGEYTTIPTSKLIDGAYLLKIICGEGKDDNSVFKIIKK